MEFTFQPPLLGACGAVAAADLILTFGFLRLAKSALLVLQYKHQAGEGRLSTDDCRDASVPIPASPSPRRSWSAILIGLGVWQLSACNGSWPDRHRERPHDGGAGRAGSRCWRCSADDAQYRRVALHGHFDNAKEAYVFTTDADGDAGLSCADAVHDRRRPHADGGPGRGAAGEARSRHAAPPAMSKARPHVVGVWRAPDAPGLFTPAPDLAHRIWYARDLAGIAAADHVSLAAPVVIEADATPNPGGWPKGGQTVVDFRNDHLHYAITWFGLAAGLLGVYLAYHHFQGPARPSIVSARSRPVTDAISFPPAAGAPKPHFADVLLAGLAPDGGLYLPRSWPQFSRGRDRRLQGHALSGRGLRHPVALRRRLLHRRRTESRYRSRLCRLRRARHRAAGARSATTAICWSCFTAPLFAFKDIALQMLGRLFARALAKRGGRATVVAATSGDTGSAAIAALGGLPNIDVFVLHPKGRVSEVQRRQMTTSAARQCPQYRAGRQLRRRPGAS